MGGKDAQTFLNKTEGFAIETNRCVLRINILIKLHS